ncbi:MAG: amidohydrolase family protein [Nitrospirota bacterium]|nr:MAG: amidohydrolase family protein [Nitrospirota bacterium]
MQIIDFHAHIFPDRVAGPALDQLTEHSGEYKPCTDGTLRGLLGSMDAAGIRMSVISNIATKPSQSYPILDFCDEIKGERIYPLISIHPENSYEEAKDLLNRAEGMGIRGVKFHPMYQDFEIDDEKMYELYGLIRDRGFFTIFHTGYDIAFPGNNNADLERVQKIADMFSDMTIVVTHTGGWRQWERVGLITGADNIYSEISMTQSEVNDDDFIKLISLFDERKIFFGTDSPWTDQADMVNRVMALSLSGPLKEGILFKNAEVFLDKYI